MRTTMQRLTLGLFTGAALCSVQPLAAKGDGLTVDRVVVMMRHGVRPPTKDPALPLSVTRQPWPRWPVKFGLLTPHGRAAIALLGQSDGAAFRAAGLLPASSCPTQGSVGIIADSDERTISTADAWAETLAPGCALPSDHPPQDVEDPRFNALSAHPDALDPAAAEAGVEAAIGKGGLTALDRQYRPMLDRLNAILCPAKAAQCGVTQAPTGLIPAANGKRPKLTGALDVASTAAHVLLLEYADGKPASDIGWGRASAKDVTALSEFHALEFRLLARPRAVASANLTGLMPAMLNVLEGAEGAVPRILMISGHDTNVANLGGLLDVHWRVPGFAQDDPAPGGAIMIERLHDGAGNRFVRVSYRAQTLSGIRTLDKGAVVRVAMPVPGCNARGEKGLCTLSQFVALMKAK